MFRGGFVSSDLLGREREVWAAICGAVICREEGDGYHVL